MKKRYAKKYLKNKNIQILSNSYILLDEVAKLSLSNKDIKAIKKFVIYH